MERAWRNRKSQASRDYIIGGEDSLEHQYPWQVYIERLKIKKGQSKT